jgi:hypothetical protein
VLERGVVFDEGEKEGRRTTSVSAVKPETTMTAKIAITSARRDSDNDVL